MTDLDGNSPSASIDGTSVEAIPGYPFRSKGKPPTLVLYGYNVAMRRDKKASMEGGNSFTYTYKFPTNYFIGYTDKGVIRVNNKGREIKGVGTGVGVYLVKASTDDVLHTANSLPEVDELIRENEYTKKDVYIAFRSANDLDLEDYTTGLVSGDSTNGIYYILDRRETSGNAKSVIVYNKFIPPNMLVTNPLKTKAFLKFILDVPQDSSIMEQGVNSVRINTWRPRRENNRITYDHHSEDFDFIDSLEGTGPATNVKESEKAKSDIELEKLSKMGSESFVEAIGNSNNSSKLFRS